MLLKTKNRAAVVYASILRSLAWGRAEMREQMAGNCQDLKNFAEMAMIDVLLNITDEFN